MQEQYNLDELPKIAKMILEKANSKVFAFYGRMGIGKTTLLREIVKQLGTTDSVSSPTFSLVNEYQYPNGLIYHFDFYRIDNEEEAYDIGFEEYLYSPNYVFIEWPEKIENLLPNTYTEIKITEVPTNITERNISIKNITIN
ncbi:tRNA threonylcarbamoyladenosine biosynthesis protein TsaE [Mesonia hippocampi]|uniref:tRNA threonylcarbamoyladenosine biosynthesis protein TsaE n=1 Tax=Mesonia hippocampi TaxID=1628250 RepID=A0A840EEZ0_9FLAO|nr:tRNA (adenosine(37)-N6)-threonylcarbamoyltransferase complex ATPase subunit type 1 TsaE [Mesonia hippocampi]MBB4117752.1 tRNA threonylcarbamoyladenosine biosynthesis protein TsaE [Mesonia hippocampi]